MRGCVRGWVERFGDMFCKIFGERFGDMLCNRFGEMLNILCSR